MAEQLNNKKQHSQKNDWCGWPCFGNQMICCPHPPPFQAISSAYALDWQHLRTSFLFSHFLTLTITSRTSYSLPQLPLTERVVWDTSLHSYRGKRANIFEELIAIEKGFCYHFPWLIQVGEHRKLSVMNKILRSQCFAFLSMLWWITYSLTIYMV